MSKLFVILISTFAALTLTASISFSADIATYNPTTGVLEVPVVLVGSNVYDVEMQRTAGLNFDVTQASPISIVDTLDYYNLQGGLTWRYRGYQVEDNGTRLESWSSNRTVTGTGTVNGLSCYMISEPGRFKSQIASICYDNEAVYHVEDDGTKFKVHDRFAYMGKKSSWDESAFNLSIESEASYENISTPAYGGEALVFTNNITDTITGETWLEKVYLADGIGLVKSVNDDEDGNYFYQNRRLTTYSQ